MSATKLNAFPSWAQEQVDDREWRAGEIRAYFRAGGASVRELIEYHNARLDALTGMMLTDALNDARRLLRPEDDCPALRRYLEAFGDAQEAYERECYDLDWMPGNYERDCQARDTKL